MTAQALYADRREQLRALMAELESRVEALDAYHAKRPGDWSAAGDLGRVLDGVSKAGDAIRWASTLPSDSGAAR